jgi:beta-lactamase class C
VLWNSASPRPNGIEYEVMYMVYHLPFRDWLNLDTPEDGAAPEAVEEPDGGEPASREPRERAAPREKADGRRRPGR